MRRLICCIMLLCLLSACSEAEIPCQCGLEECLCFIQFGDKGRAVAFIQAILVQRGYLTKKEVASYYDTKTESAVKAFQQDNNLVPTGTMDDDTLTLLIWGMLPEQLDLLQPWSIGLPVWIPTDCGERHHRETNCAPHLLKISDPRLVSHRNAMALGFAPCGICNPSGLDTDLTR